MALQNPSRTERLTRVRDNLVKVYEAEDLPPHLRALLAELERKPPKRPARPN
jgi:hypothetical protein